MNHIKIIAEIGVNHNGNIEIAKELISGAINAGADIIKFQTFIPEKIATKYAKKAAYQKVTKNSNQNQREMLKNLFLSYREQEKLKNYCESKGAEFLSTAFEIESIDFLESLNLKRYKIPSGEITNLPYIKRIGRIGKPIIISTGMCRLTEIEDILYILEHEGIRRDRITILHCSSEYPAPYEDINLSCIETIRKAFKVNVGYSDHTNGIEVAIAAAALGAKIIEKHITLNQDLEGPDHKASINIEEFSYMVKCIRNIEKAIGNGIKRPSKVEKQHRILVRKSLVASKSIKKGEKYTLENITTKRPGDGISPMKIDEVIGKLSTKEYQEDDQIIL